MWKWVQIGVIQETGVDRIEKSEQASSDTKTLNHQPNVRRGEHDEVLEGVGRSALSEGSKVRK